MRGIKVSAGRRSGRAILGILIGVVATCGASASTRWHWHWPLTLSGTPATTDVAGKAYSFTPGVSGNYSGATLTYSISGKPSWAAFNTSTGQLSGTPSVAAIGSYPNIAIKVSNGSTSASLTPFAISVTAPANSTPTISGQPATTVKTGAAYSFTPTASDAIGAPLSFSIQNMPAWATFSIATGQLSGTPSATYAGTYANVVISVSDGVASAALPAFSIAVTQPVSSGTATVNWTPPVTNTDGSAITNLSGYNIHYGNVSTNLSQTVQLSNVGLTSYTMTNLSSGTWYFAVTAYNSTGAESALSNVSSKTNP
jgi:hypothetical protein